MLPEHLPRVGMVVVLAALLAACAGGPQRRSSADPMQTSAVAQRAINNAQALLALGRMDEALLQSQEALRADPRSAQAHIVHAGILEALGREDDAARSQQRALALAPASGPILNAHGAWLCRNGRFDEALQAFSRATLDEAYRDPEQALGNAGTCAAQAGRMEMAELNFRAALGLAPTQAQSLTGMARVAQRRGDLLTARAFLQRREAVGPLGGAELSLGIEIETAAGDLAAASRYRKQLATLVSEAKGAASSSDGGSSRQ